MSEYAARRASLALLISGQCITAIGVYSLLGRERFLEVLQSGDLIALLIVCIAVAGGSLGVAAILLMEE